jgi:hypothetical protein
LWLAHLRSRTPPYPGRIGGRVGEPRACERTVMVFFATALFLLLIHSLPARFLVLLVTVIAMLALRDHHPGLQFSR